MSGQARRFGIACPRFWWGSCARTLNDCPCSRRSRRASCRAGGMLLGQRPDAGDRLNSANDAPLAPTCGSGDRGRVDDLTFRTTGRQLRNLLIGAVVVTALGAAAGVAVADHAGGGGGPLPSAIGLGIAALIYLYALVAYAVAHTECTPAGIRTRGLGGRRSCRWAD